MARPSGGAAGLLALLALAGCGGAQEPPRPADDAGLTAPTAPAAAPGGPAAAQPAPDPLTITLALPDGDEQAFPHELAAALKAGAKRIVIPPGVHRVLGLPPAAGREPWAAVVENASDIEIDGRGATLLLTDRRRAGINFVSCARITLRGLRVQRATPAFSQGMIEAVDAAANTVDVRVAAGYPQDIDDPRFFTHVWMNVFAPTPPAGQTRRWLTHLRSATPPVMQKLAADLWRIKVEPLKTSGVPITAGQPVAWRGEVFSDIRLSRCADMRLVGVTVAQGAGFCFHEMGGDGGNRYEDCAVTFAPRPAGATMDPLLASAADGFHASDARRGPTLVGCSFEGTDDDAIAIHGNYGMAMEGEGGGGGLVVQRVPFASDRGFARVGDRLRFYDLGAVAAGEATVTAVQQLPGYQRPFEPDQAHQMFRNQAGAGFARLTLDHPLPALAGGWLVANADACCAGYVVRGCTISGTYARGIIAKASDGLIEDCTIEHTARAAVEFNTETGIWSEADYARHVTVRNNTFRDVSFNRKTGLLRHAGALAIFAHRPGGYIASPGGHRDILIEGNRFIDNAGVNLLICSAQGVTVRGNVFSGPLAVADSMGTDKQVDPSTLVWVDQAADVSFAGNTVSGAGPFMKHLVVTTPRATTSGVEGGVTVVTAP